VARRSATKPAGGMQVVSEKLGPERHESFLNGETKAERFKRIGVPRVRRVLEGMGRLRHIANRATYEYSPEDAAKVLEALRKGVDELENAFKGQRVTTHFEL